MTAQDLLSIIGEAKEAYIQDAQHLRTRKEQPRIPPGRLWLIAAIVALLLLLVGCATAYIAGNYLPEDSWFVRFFSNDDSDPPPEGATDHQLEILERGLVDIGQSVTDNGYTITLESAISDGNQALLLFHIDAPEGTLAEDGIYTLKSRSDIHMPGKRDGNVSVMSTFGIPLPDSDPTDDSVSFLLQYTCQPPAGVDFSMAQGDDWTVTVYEINEQRGAGETMRYQTIQTGQWIFRVRFSEDMLITGETELLEEPVRCLGRRQLGNHFFDVKVKVTSFRLHTLSAKLCYSKPLTGYWEGITLRPIYLIMKDGTTVAAQFRIAANRGSYTECTYIFDRPVSHEDVAYICFPSSGRIPVGPSADS